MTTKAKLNLNIPQRNELVMLTILYPPAICVQIHPLPWRQPVPASWHLRRLHGLRIRGREGPVEDQVGVAAQEMVTCPAGPSRSQGVPNASVAPLPSITSGWQWTERDGFGQASQLWGAMPAKHHELSDLKASSSKRKQKHEWVQAVGLLAPNCGPHGQAIPGA